MIQPGLNWNKTLALLRVCLCLFVVMVTYTKSCPHSGRRANTTHCYTCSCPKLGPTPFLCPFGLSPPHEPIIINICIIDKLTIVNLYTHTLESTSSEKSFESLLRHHFTSTSKRALECRAKTEAQKDADWLFELSRGPLCLCMSSTWSIIQS